MQTTDFRIAVVTNRLKVNVFDDIDRLIQYEKDTLGLTVKYTVFKTDLDLLHKPFGIYTVTDGVQKELYGLRDAKDQLRSLNLIPENLYHACIFIYDLEDTRFARNNPGAKIAHWTVNELYPGTEFIEIATKKAWDSKNDVTRVLTHEIRHAYNNRLRRRGFGVPDYMDMTPVLMPDNTLEYIPYYKEYDMTATDSNRQVTNRILSGYLEQITAQPKLTNLITQIMSLVKKVIPPTQPSTRIIRWAEAIKKHEGWYVGSRSHRNNNPGNAKYLGQKGSVGHDKDGFAIFSTYDAGWTYLLTILRNAASGKSRVYQSHMTLYEFFATYAPAEDSNNPKRYAEVVASYIGVAPTTQLYELLA